ncbi:hypothetical protein THIOM_003839 [Candidatus Thiomargarita nelsonii]|uniref:Uncharacterized protein n=1 Tax=Candidatus Thiomargarita nelsonii TaxID=1003181 RepID=A0A176RXN5_9GAMM|nr:hypothetical protein THIOM_003839 [Candidatus Thiomargarita nelsonii]
MIGRLLPFKRRTESSSLMATTKRSPNCRACVKYWTCPACKISKQPLVMTTVSPLACAALTATLRLLASCTPLPVCLCKACSSSNTLIVVAPSLVTAMPAARLAKAVALVQS